MIGWVTRNTRWIFLIVCLGLSGCSPTSENVADEQADANFIAGRNRRNNLDFPGAIEGFEKALENNPRSASAHFEIGLIYYQNLVDYAAAVYHFRKFLQLRPSDAHADTVRQFINVSIQELARSVSLGPVSIEVQKQLNRLADENWKLKQQVDLLHKALTLATNRTATPSMIAPGATNQPAPAIAPIEKPAPKSTPPSNASPNAGAKISGSSTRTKTRDEQSAPSAKAPTGRTHLVRTGESAEGIARRYGIRFSSLLVANPQLDPKRMKPGQVLKIPAS